MFFFDFQYPACIMLGLMNVCVPAVVFHSFERKTEFEHSKSKAIYEKSFFSNLLKATQ